MVIKHLIIISCSILMSCTLFAQDIDEETTDSIPESERFHFSAENDLYFHEELSFENLMPIDMEPPSPIKVSAIPCGDGGWRICFNFPKPILYSQESDACHICLEFNQPLASTDFSQMEEALGFLAPRINTGYNTLYIGTEKPSLFCTQYYDHIFILDIYPDYCADPPGFIPRLLKLARARLLVETRLFAQAFCALNALLLEYPGDKDVWTLAGDLENVVPRWQRSLAIFNALRARFPYDNNIQISLHDVFYPHSSYIRLERETLRFVHEALEHVWKLSGEWIASSSIARFIYLGGSIAHLSGHISEVIQSDGTIEPFHGTRLQGQVYLREEFSNGIELTASVYATEGVVMGGGLRGHCIVPCLQGTFAVEIDWHKPYWATYETFAHFGRENKIEGFLTSIYNRFFDSYLNGGVHRVGIDHITNGFSSGLLNWGAYWHFYVNGATDVSLHYDFDAEYVFSRARRTDINGNPFEPVPFVSYEFHTVKCDFVHQWRYWELRAEAGYTINRLGIGGVNVVAGLHYQKPCPCGWELSITAAQFPSSTVAGATEQTFNISATKRF